MSGENEQFYLRYYSGHNGRFGHEFLGMPSPCPHLEGSRQLMHVEFDFRVLGDGRSAMARYANNSNYRNDSLIRKESASFYPPSKPLLT